MTAARRPTDSGTDLATAATNPTRPPHLKSLFQAARRVGLPYAVAYALVTAPLLAQGTVDPTEPSIAVTGVGRLFVRPTQAIVSLGATVQRERASDAQRELDAVIQEALSSIRELGIAAENLQTASLSLMPVYAESSDGGVALARRDEPRIVAYRATNLVQVTIDDLAMVSSVVDAGVAAGVNEIRNISFGLEDELPYRVTALERAVEAARRKALAAANALGVRLAEPTHVSERGAAVPRRELETAFARSESSTPVEPGEITIEAVVDVTFRLEGGGVPAGRN